jgi:transposase
VPGGATGQGGTPGPKVIGIDEIAIRWDGIAAYCKPENKVSLGFVEGLNNKIRVIQRRAYGLQDEEYLRLKILTCMLPVL